MVASSTPALPIGKEAWGFLSRTRRGASSALRRRAGTHCASWAPDQQRNTPQTRRIAQHPGHGPSPSTAPHRRHGDLVAAAAAAVDFLAGSELQVLAEADADLAEPGAVAGHGDGGCREARIDLDEGVLDVGGRDRLGLVELQIFGRDLDAGARFADGLEIGVVAEARAGAVLVPFIVDQARRRHQVEHRGHDVAVEPGRWPLAIFRKAVLILRPQTVHHEGEWPSTALALLRTPAIAAFFGFLAERGRP